MNHAYIPYDLVINEPVLTCSECGGGLVNDEPHRLGECFKPGTVVRETKPYPGGRPRIGAVKDGRVVESSGSEFWAFELVDSEWEPLPADDPANIYPGDKVVCLNGDYAGEVSKVGKWPKQPHLTYAVDLTKKGSQPLIYDRKQRRGFNLQFAILEPATTPIAEIEEGDEVVCRKGSDAYVGQAGIVQRSTRMKGWLYADLGRDRTPYLDVAGRQWLVTKKAAAKDKLTMDERSRLTKLLCGATGVVTDADRGTIGHIIDDCIQRGWMPEHSKRHGLRHFRWYSPLGVEFTSWHPYTLVGIARAYLEAREKWG